MKKFAYRLKKVLMLTRREGNLGTIYIYFYSFASFSVSFPEYINLYTIKRLGSRKLAKGAERGLTIKLNEKTNEFFSNVSISETNIHISITIFPYNIIFMYVSFYMFTTKRKPQFRIV